VKQPLMVVPPAQAEILYDAALEDEHTDVPKRTRPLFSFTDQWDDRDFADNCDRRNVKSVGAAAHHRH